MKREQHYTIPALRLVQNVTPEPDWPEFGIGPAGHRVRLANAGALPEAERAQVYFERDGIRVYPWKEAGYYVDAETGKPFWVDIDPAALLMSRDELEGLGFTDDELRRDYAKHFPDRRRLAAELDPHGDSTPQRVLRRRLFDELMGALYG